MGGNEKTTGTMKEIENGIIINGILYEAQHRCGEYCHCDECDLREEICTKESHTFIGFCIKVDASSFERKGKVLNILTKEEKEHHDKESEMTMELLGKLAKVQDETHRTPVLFFPAANNRTRYRNLCQKVAKFFCEKVGVGEAYHLYDEDGMVKLYIEDVMTGEEYHVATWGDSSGKDMMTHYFSHPEFYEEMI